MNPNQMPVGPPPEQQNQYDFITNPGAAPKKTMFPGGDSLMKRVMLVVGGAVVLMVLATIVISLLTSGSQGPTQAMKDLVLEQQNIVLLSADGAKEAASPDVKSLAITSQLSVQTDLTNTNNYLASDGQAVDSKLLATLLDAETTATLTTAKSSNRYDETFEALLRNKLSQYQLNLQNIFNSTDSEDAKAVLSEAFTSASNLLAPPVANE